MLLSLPYGLYREELFLRLLGMLSLTKYKAKYWLQHDLVLLPDLLFLDLVRVAVFELFDCIIKLFEYCQVSRSCFLLSHLCPELIFSLFIYVLFTYLLVVLLSFILVIHNPLLKIHYSVVLVIEHSYLLKTFVFFSISIFLLLYDILPKLLFLQNLKY
jgi:hypothetical protein